MFVSSGRKDAHVTMALQSAGLWLRLRVRLPSQPGLTGLGLGCHDNKILAPLRPALS